MVFLEQVISMIVDRVCPITLLFGKMSITEDGNSVNIGEILHVIWKHFVRRPEIYRARLIMSLLLKCDLRLWVYEQKKSDY